MDQVKLTAEESKQANENAMLYTHDRVKNMMQQTAEKKKKVKADVDTNESTTN
jgi:hypothetical protein